LPGWGDFLARAAVADLALGAVLWWGSGDLEHWLTWSAGVRGLNLALWIAAGGAAYFAMLAVTGVSVRGVLVGRAHLRAQPTSP
jgi:putative peptidoglycan lipid II flippase